MIRILLTPTVKKEKEEMEEQEEMEEKEEMEGKEELEEKEEMEEKDVNEVLLGFLGSDTANVSHLPAVSVN